MIRIDKIRVSLFKWCFPILWLVLIGLMFFSVVALIAASQWGLDTNLFPKLAKLQTLWFLVGILSFTLVYILGDFDVILELSPLIATIVLILLFWTKLFGISIYGSKRWISLGLFTLQPSEFAKFSSLLMVSYAYKYRDSHFRLVLSVILILVTLGMIIVQPDLGTTLVILSAILISVFFMGIPTWIFIGNIASFSLLLPILWNHLKDYQKLRIKYFLNPSIDPHGHGYNIIQALIAVGAGGKYGMGLWNATQAKFGFLPVATADFLFASFAQALGFIGVVTLFLLYAVFFFCMWMYGAMVSDITKKSYIYGTLWIWFFTFWINIGMNIGVMPVTGVPLPFFSYGGTQTISNFIMLALVVLATKESAAHDITKLRFGGTR